jgi:YVTN family beta-propeller protein
MTHSKPIVMLLALSSFAGCSSGMNGAIGIGSSKLPPAKAYVGLFGDNAVGVIDLDAGQIMTTIPVPAPDGLVIRPDGSEVYVSSNNGRVVDVIDTATDTVKTAIDVGMQPAGLSITADGKYVVVSVQGDGQAAIIDTATDTVLTKSPVGKAHNSALSADGTLAFVASQLTAAPAVDVVDLPSGKAGTTIPLDLAPRAVCDLSGRLYATLAGSGDIAVFDATSGLKGTSITTAGSPHDIRPSVDGSLVLTVSQTAGELELIDPTMASVIAHVPTGKMPHWIGLSSDGALAYVTNEGDNNLVVIDLATHVVKKTIAVGNAPRKIAIER